MEAKPSAKNTMRRRVLKKLFFALPIGLVVALAIFAPIHVTHASVGSIIAAPFKFIFGQMINVAYYVLGKVMFFIGYLISYICGVFIGIEAWLIAVVLNINDGVFQSAIVQTGFSASLSLANLGFVFGIIIIAIATILRRETYGIKQILWKLVVMAILVNFGLVIMGAIFNFTDQFTNYFLQCIDPTGGGCGGTQSVFTSENNFAQSLAGAFNPQRGFLVASNLNSTGTTSGSLDMMAGVGSDIGKMLVPIFSVFFLSAALIIIVITLAAFIVMLLIRYVYIAILAVLLPFAWMLWIFPKTKNNFDKWWGKFIQWTIFAPIVLFFLWLALTTAHGLSTATGGAQSFATYTSPSNSIFGSISNYFGNFWTPIIQNILNEIVLAGLVVGGMLAANSLGIAGAKEALHAMKSVGTNVAMKAHEKATAPLRTKERQQRFTQMQQRTGFRGLASRWTGRALETLGASGTKGPLAAQYEKEVGALTKEQALNQLSTTGAGRRQAILRRAEKEGWHDDARVQQHLGKEKEGEAQRYGNEKTFEELRDKSGLSLIGANKTGDSAKILVEVKKLASKNPDALASFFINDASLEKMKEKLTKNGIAMPITLQQDSLASAKREIVKALPDLSQTNVSSVLTEIAKKNNLGEFEKAAKSLTPDEQKETKAKFEANSTLKKWVEKGSYRTVVDLNDLYKLGLKTEDDNKEKPKVILTGSDRESNPPRSRTTF